jgi:hypothetical protein
VQFDTNTPRNPRTIAGLALSVIAPFAEGQTLTPALAAILNQTIAENISNNTRKSIEAGQGGDTNVPHTVETAQALVDAYMAEYEPGVRRSGSGEPRVVNPVEREARNLAKNKAKEFVASKGLKAKDVDMAAITTAIYDKYSEQFLAAAKKIVDARNKAENNAGELDFGDIEPLAAAPAETA